MNRQQEIRDAMSAGKAHYIFSVFPMAMKAERAYNGATTYTLPAAKEQGEVTSCRVGNAFQFTYVGDGKWHDVPIFSDDIARDLLQEFGGSMVGQDQGHGPGIWMQELPDPDPALVEEYSARQVAFFEHLVNEADGLHKGGKANEITDLHRNAARWLGYLDFAWLEKLKPKSTKECTSCYSMIDGRAKICPICNSRQEDAAPPAPAATRSKKE